MRMVIEKAGEEVHRIPSGEKVEVVAILSEGSFIHRFILTENSQLIYRGAMIVEGGELRGRVEVLLSGSESRADVELRGFVKGKLDIHMIGVVEKGARESEVRVASLVYQSEGAEVRAIPQLDVHELRSRSFHSFKKIYIGGEELFYLRSRGVDPERIDGLMKERVIEWIRKS